MATNETVSVEVMDYATGEKLGDWDMPKADHEKYEAENHPAYQWPGGLAEAGDLGLDELLGIDADKTVYLS